MHTPSLVKIHWYLLKLSSGNENTDGSMTDGWTANVAPTILWPGIKRCLLEPWYCTVPSCLIWCFIGLNHRLSLAVQSKLYSLMNCCLFLFCLLLGIIQRWVQTCVDTSKKSNLMNCWSGKAAKLNCNPVRSGDLGRVNDSLVIVRSVK